MRVIAYTYEADYHCIACTVERHRHRGFKYVAASPADDITQTDENDVPYCATDREGNLIHPFFSTDEGSVDDFGRSLGATCGDCHDVIRECEAI